MHYLLKSAAAISVLSLMTGCASVAGEKMQPITIQTIHDSKEVAGVNCTLTNDAGSWNLTTPGSVTVHKSTGDLAVDCKKDDLAGHQTLVSKSNGAVWGNILAGGGIGYIIDRNTGAGFDYPNSIVVVIQKIGEAVGLTSKPTTTASASAKQTTENKN